MSDLRHQRLVELARELRLSTVPDLYFAIAQSAVAKEASFADFVEEILRAERDARRIRTREMFARIAGFPTVKTIDGFDFGLATGVPRRQIHELAGLAFIERAENIVFLGPPVSAKRIWRLRLAIWRHRTGTRCASPPRPIWS